MSELSDAVQIKPEVAVSGFSYPDYTREEKIADGIIHFLGISGAIFGVWLIANHIIPSTASQYTMALTVYGACIVALFCFSGAYHMTPWTHHRPVLRRFDQAAIFMKIAGTYTPFVFLVNSTFSYLMLALIWLAALMGGAAKLITGDRLDKHTVVLYLAMGWASVLLIWPMFQTLPFIDAWLVVVGGMLYTIGVIFHQWDDLKYQNAIWHAFVLVAATCHFMAIADAALALGN